MLLYQKRTGVHYFSVYFDNFLYELFSIASVLSCLFYIHFGSSPNFDYKFDCKQIEFLDTLVYIDQQNKLQTTLFRKSSDRQDFLNAKSEHP